MKTSTLFLGLALLGAAPAATAAPLHPHAAAPATPRTADGGRYVCVTAGVANLRRSPSASGEVPYRVARCQLLPVVGTAGQWTCVSWQGEQLYIATKLVRSVEAAVVTPALLGRSYVSVKQDEGMLPARLSFEHDAAGLVRARIERPYADTSQGVAESAYVGKLPGGAGAVRLWEDPTWIDGLETLQQHVEAARGESPDFWYELVYDAATGHFFLCDDEFAPAP